MRLRRHARSRRCGGCTPEWESSAAVIDKASLAAQVLASWMQLAHQEAAVHRQRAGGLTKNVADVFDVFQDQITGNEFGNARGAGPECEQVGLPELYIGRETCSCARASMPGEKSSASTAALMLARNGVFFPVPHPASISWQSGTTRTSAVTDRSRSRVRLRSES